MNRLQNLMRATPLVAALWLTGCVNLAPTLERPALPVPTQLPAADGAAAGAVAQPTWQSVVQDAHLSQVVELALANNRDLKVSLLNVQRAQAQLRLTDADRWPTLSAALIGQRAPNSEGVQATTLQAGLQLSSYEIDLLGRLRNASDAASASLMGTEAAARSARLALVSQTVGAWLTLAADEEQLIRVKQQLVAREETLRLTALRERVGAASALDLQSAQSLVAAAKASALQLERQKAQDKLALDLVVGKGVPAELLPSAALTSRDWLAPVQAGVSSDALLSRPDVIQAEQQLAAANANIGAARAAMFPRIVLSGSAGQVSSSLSTLFDGGHFAWSMTANAAMTLFDAGRNQANIKVSEVNRDIAVAQYEKAVQTAFREAADALVSQGSWAQQVQAHQQLVAAERERTRLTRLRLQVGSASLLETLETERSLASAEQALVQVKLAELLNRMALYKALGGDEARQQR